MPVGGGDTSDTGTARTGWQPAGSQSPRSKTQTTNDLGRAALGATKPGRPSSQSASPTA